eukprot:jgi/Botrbrau1/16048/Bobra.7_2s0022.1
MNNDVQYLRIQLRVSSHILQSNYTMSQNKCICPALSSIARSSRELAPKMFLNKKPPCSTQMYHYGLGLVRSAHIGDWGGAGQETEVHPRTHLLSRSTLLSFTKQCLNAAI